MCKQPKKPAKKVMFLTHAGLMRLLFASQNTSAKRFIGWATDKLFTVQMGTVEQRADIAGQTMGVCGRAVNEAFCKSAKSMPAVCLFTLGTVKQLRETMRIGMGHMDDALVCGYGMGLDAMTSKYMGIGSLTHHSQIDPMYVSRAEQDTREFFKGLGIGLNHETHDGLVVVRPDLVKTVQSHYKYLTDTYAGHGKALIGQIEQMATQIERIESAHMIAMTSQQHRADMLAKDLEMEKLRNKNDLLVRDLEIQKLRAELMGKNKSKK
jgi:hypothetical protein